MKSQQGMLLQLLRELTLISYFQRKCTFIRNHPIIVLALCFSKDDKRGLYTVLVCRADNASHFRNSVQLACLISTLSLSEFFCWLLIGFLLESCFSTSKAKLDLLLAANLLLEGLTIVTFSV